MTGLLRTRFKTARSGRSVMFFSCVLQFGKERRANMDEKIYIVTENDAHETELVFKKNGKVDLSKPPKGYKFVPYPLDTSNDQLRISLDPRFITKHKFSSTKHDAFFLLVKIDKESGKQMYKTDYARDERWNKRFTTFSVLATQDEDTDNERPIDIEAPFDLEDTVIVNIIHEEIRAKLRKWDDVNRLYNESHPASIPRMTHYEDIYVVYYMWMDSIREAAEDLGLSRSSIGAALKKIRQLLDSYKD